jgi:tetratricopeptide (TPR) repeat protein
VDAAIAEYRKAIELKPDFADAYNSLGNALDDKGEADAAVAAYRKAIELKPDVAGFHDNLGVTLLKEGNVDAAIAEFRKAIELKPDYAPAHNHLGSALRWVKLNGKLAAVLSGEQPVRDAAERVEYADLCYNKRLFAAAARFFEQALDEKPELAEDPRGHRYNAVCCASLAASGNGDDAASLDDATRERWRQKALDWLRADLARLANALPTSQPAERGQILQQLQWWQRDRDLAGIRDAEAIAKLPESEQQSWRTLWNDVEKLVKQKK